MKYTIYAVDRAGNSWTVGSYIQPDVALAHLRIQQANKSVGTSGCYVDGNEESGDVDLEQIISDAEWDAEQVSK